MSDAQRWERRQKVLANFGEFALRSDDLDAVLTEACRLVADALGTGRAKVLEIEHEERTLFVRAGVGWDEGVVGSLRLPMGEHSSETYSIKAGEPVITNDLASEHRFDFPDFMKEASVKALANVPIFLPGGMPFGLLQVDAAEPRAFDDEDSQFLRTYATILGPVIDRLLKVQSFSAKEERFSETLRKSEERHRFLLTLGDAMRTASSANGKIEVAAQHLGERLKASRVLWAEYDWTSDLAYIFNGWFADGAQPFPTVMRLKDYAGEVLNDLKAGQIVRVDNVERFAEKPGYAAIAAVGVQALLSVPLIAGDALKVNISIHQHEPRHWTDDEAALVHEVAERLWAEVVRARSEAALRESEEKFRTLFDAIDEGLAIQELVYDERSEIVDVIFRQVNAAYERQSGLHDVVGRSLFDVLPRVEDYWLGLYRELARTGRPVRVQNYQQDVDGWFDVYFSPVGKSRQFVAHVFNNITERKRLDAVLRESEERQGFLLKLSDAYREHPDEASIAATCVDTLARHLGVDRCYIAEMSEDLGKALIASEFHKEGLPPMAGWHSLDDYPQSLRQFRNGMPMIFTNTADDRRFSASEKQMLHGIGFRAFMSTPLYRGAGNSVFAITVGCGTPREWTSGDLQLVKDVTERTWAAMERARAETALRESEERFRPIVQNARDYAIFTLDTDGRITDWFHGAEQVFGWSVDEAQGQPVEITFTADDRAAGAPAKEMETASRDGTAPNVRWHVRKDGSLVFIDGITSAIRDRDGRLRGYVKIGQDVTSRRAAEEALRESEERLRQFGEASLDVIWIRDVETLQWQYLTPAFEDIYGLSREEALKGNNFRSWLDLIVPEDRADAAEKIRQVREGQHVAFEYRIRRPSDRAIRYLRDTSFPIFDKSGKVKLIGGIGRDFTARRESERRFETLVREMPQLVWRAIDGGHWTWASPQWTEFTGQPEVESHGSGWLKPVHPDDREQVTAIWDNAIARGEFAAEYRIYHQSEDQYRWFQTRATPMHGAAGELIEWLGTSTDVHDLRMLQDRQQILVAELQHRTRNLIAVVRSISNETLSSGCSLDELKQAFSSRLESLSRVQGLLSRSDSEPITFGALVDLELQALGADSGDRVYVRGPAVQLNNATVQTIALALHELATNARKYGALASDTGFLRIIWSLTDEWGSPWLSILWEEDGISKRENTDVPSGGYGRRLIEGALPYTLAAKVKYELQPHQLRCSIQIPLEAH